MKKLVFSSLFFIAIFSTGANAQEIAFNRSNAARGVNPFPEVRTKIVSEVEVNINAVRDFKTNFRNATNVKWTLHENGASVFFTNDGMKMRSTYNQKGRKMYTLKYYDESRMPVELRQRVKSNYYDHNIAVVTEAITNSQTYYLVKMENAKEFLTIKVIDDEMSVYEQITKRK